MIKITIKKNMPSLILVILILGVLVFIYINTQSIHFVDHNRYMNTLVQLQEHDTLINEAVLKLRYGYLYSYDVLVLLRDKQEYLISQLEPIPEFVSHETKIQLAQYTKNYLEHIHKKSERLERFKSQNASYQNSLAFLPKMITDLTHNVILPLDNFDSFEQEQFIIDLHDLLRLSLQYNQSSNTYLLSNIITKLETIAAYIEQLKRDVTSKDRYNDRYNDRYKSSYLTLLEELERIYNHADHIASLKPELMDNTKDILIIPVKSVLHQLVTSYYSEFNMQLTLRRNYRLFLYLVAILLVAVTAYTILRLRNTSNALYAANMHLEQRVKDRTTELNEKNKILARKNDEIQEDLKKAKAIQDKMLTSVFTYKNINFTYRYIPLIEVGGDIFDIEQISEGYIRIFLADAEGHGVQAALLTMLVRTYYERLKHIPELDILIQQLNEDILTIYKEKQITIIFPCIIVDIDINNHAIHYVSAGHNDQHLQLDNTWYELHSSARLIGFLSNLNPRIQSFTFKQSFRLCLFTDGLIEQIDEQNREYGEERVKKQLSQIPELKSADDLYPSKPIPDAQSMDDSPTYSITNLSLDAIINILIEDVHQFRKNVQVMDDITILGMEYHVERDNE